MSLFSKKPPLPSQLATTAISDILAPSLISSTALANALTEGICITDTQGAILAFNNSLAELSGYTPAEAASLHFKTVLRLINSDGIPPEDDQNPIHQATQTNQEIASDSFELIKKSGEKLPIRLRVIPITENNTRNIVTIIKNSESYHDLQDQKSDFISTASHEMRTPITAIDGFLALLANPATATLDERAQNYVQKAQNSTQHLKQLFQDLLDVSQNDDNHLQLRLQPLDALDVVKQAVAEFQPAAAAKGLQLTFTNAEGLQPEYLVKADANRLLEILHNLLENAVKYTPRGSITVGVRTGDSEEEVQIFVTDTGIGIKPEDIPHLFQKFSRIDNSDTREIGGTGLGLYLVKQLTEKMSGEVKVQSIPGQGTTFAVEFPCLSPSQAKFLQTGDISTNPETLV